MIVSTEGAGRALVEALTTDRTAVFTEHDTDADRSSRARATTIAGGRSNIPVILTPDGTVLVEPTNVELAATLGAQSGRTSRSRCR